MKAQTQITLYKNEKKTKYYPQKDLFLPPYLLIL